MSVAPAGTETAMRPQRWQVSGDVRQTLETLFAINQFPAPDVCKGACEALSQHGDLLYAQLVLAVRAARVGPRAAFVCVCPSLGSHLRAPLAPAAPTRMLTHTHHAPTATPLPTLVRQALLPSSV
jgi:hypothetical protein